jgi:hypothetical protein
MKPDSVGSFFVGWFSCASTASTTSFGSICNLALLQENLIFISSPVRSGAAGSPCAVAFAAPARCRTVGSPPKTSIRKLNPAGRIKVYDKNGKFLGQSNPVKEPVHLAVHDGRLYVSGGNEVLTAKLSKLAGDFTLSSIPGLQLHTKVRCGLQADEV